MLNKLALLVAVSSEIDKGLRVDGTIGVLAIFAIISFISPIAVACINNKNQAKEREKEREYETQKRDQVREDEIKKREQQIQAEIEKQKMENDFKLQMHKYDSYYKYQTQVYESLLDAVGDYLGNITDLDKYSFALSSIYKAHAYADESLAFDLGYLRQEIIKINKGDNENDCSYFEAVQQLGEVAKIMNTIMKRNANIKDCN